MQLEEDDHNFNIPDDLEDDLSRPERMLLFWSLDDDLYLFAEVTIYSINIEPDGPYGHPHLGGKVKVLDLKPYLSE